MNINYNKIVLNNQLQIPLAEYYLNIFDIIHRDIKPEHLLLDDKYE